MVREEKERIYMILAGLENPMALASQVETIYLHQAPKELDEWQLLGEINKEVLIHRRLENTVNNYSTKRRADIGLYLGEAM